MTTVFISYAVQDKALAAQVANTLLAAGIQVWDSGALKAGDDVLESLERGLEAATHGLFLMSPASVRSAWAKREYLHFLSQNKPLYVAQIRPVDDDDIPYYLSSAQWLDLTHDFEDQVKQLVEVILANAPEFNVQNVDTGRGAAKTSQVTVTLEVEEDTDTQKVVDLISRLSEIGIKDIKVVNGSSKR
jgi:hypothetical protein